MKELWDERLTDGSLTGGILVRGEKVPAGRYHMVCECIIRHRDGSYLLMRRDLRKEAYPGYWEIGAGGSALRGEDAITCIRREVREETGIARGEFSEFGITVVDDTIYHEFVCITDWDKDAIILQEGETIGHRWANETEFARFRESDEVIDTQLKRFAPYFA